MTFFRSRVGGFRPISSSLPGGHEPPEHGNWLRRTRTPFAHRLGRWAKPLQRSGRSRGRDACRSWNAASGLSLSHSDRPPGGYRGGVNVPGLLLPFRPVRLHEPVRPAASPPDPADDPSAGRVGSMATCPLSATGSRNPRPVLTGPLPYLAIST
jgi:hypothetical protein